MKIDQKFKEFGINSLRFMQHVCASMDPMEKWASALVKVDAFIRLVGINTAPAAEVVNSFKAVPTVFNLFKLPGTIAFFVDPKGWNRASGYRRSFMVTVLFVDALSLVESLVKFKLIDPARVSNLASKIPVVGERVSKLNVGIIIQPFLIMLSSISLAEQISKVPENNRTMTHIKSKISLWKKANDNIDADLRLRTSSKNTPELFAAHPESIKTRKVEKWESKRVNAERQQVKSGITIATDVAKIVCAVATLALLTGVAAASLPALPAVVVTIAAVAAILNAAKGTYGVYASVNQKEVRPVYMTAFAASAA